MPRLSIIVPVLNEASGIVAQLAALAPLRAQGAELIVVDGSSDDGSADLARPLADRVLSSARGRALQMNTGALHAQAEALLFLHADTQLPPQALALVVQALRRDGGALWGRFDVQIVGRPLMLRVVALCMNLRSRLSGIATGDQAMFVRRSAFDAAGGFPQQPLMEDIELSLRLRRLGPPATLRAKVLTSGRRWEARGVWRTIVLMWWLRWSYWRGASQAQLLRMAQAYW